MRPDDDDIPILTDAIDRAPATQSSLSVDDIDRLQDKLCATSLKIAESTLRDAVRDAEHELRERVMTALRRELPALVRDVLDEHLKRRA
ncbi:MAG: hypothetical protein U5K76_06775 [Woeseiaceae bacterium]|nr:hypothetical protein [Woeseiaceae bacterium]